MGVTSECSNKSWVLQLSFTFVSILFFNHRCKDQSNMELFRHYMKPHILSENDRIATGRPLFQGFFKANHCLDVHNAHFKTCSVIFRIGLCCRLWWSILFFWQRCTLWPSCGCFSDARKQFEKLVVLKTLYSIYPSEIKFSKVLFNVKCLLLWNLLLICNPCRIKPCQNLIDRISQ